MFNENINMEFAEYNTITVTVAKVTKKPQQKVYFMNDVSWSAGKKMHYSTNKRTPICGKKCGHGSINAGRWIVYPNNDGGSSICANCANKLISLGLPLPVGKPFKYTK